ncbi:MAG: glycosyltransferase family 2 protein [Clostridia bacterium]|jgi:group 2 glycosyl transferase
MKKISVIIPVYNTEKYLKRCFDSVIEQNYPNVELVIINDGSKDNSEIIIKEYKDKHPDLISYYKKDNTGVADTRNFGIEKATGDYIMFLDSDDYIDKALFKNLENYINNEVELIKFKLQRVDDSGKTLEIVPGATFETKTGEEGFNDLYSTDVLLDSPCVYLIKKDIFVRNNLKFAVGTEHEDFGLIPFIIVFAKTMASINFYGYYYVQSDNSITRNEDYNKTIKKAYDALKHYDNAIKLTNEFNLNKRTKQNLRIYYTNAIILKTKELHEKEQEEFIKEIQQRKMVKNIRIRNLKQLIKRILLCINIKWYLQMK